MSAVNQGARRQHSLSWLHGQYIHGKPSSLETMDTTRLLMCTTDGVVGLQKLIDMLVHSLGWQMTNHRAGSFGAPVRILAQHGAIQTIGSQMLLLQSPTKLVHAACQVLPTPAANSGMLESTNIVIRCQPVSKFTTTTQLFTENQLHYTKTHCEQKKVLEFIKKTYTQ